MFLCALTLFWSTKNPSGMRDLIPVALTVELEPLRPVKYSVFSFLKLFPSLLRELHWKLFREVLVKVARCNFTDQVQSEELKETSFSPRSSSGSSGAGRGCGSTGSLSLSRLGSGRAPSAGDGKLSSPSLLADSAAGDQPSSHGQPGPLQRQSLRERHRAGEGGDRNVQ